MGSEQLSEAALRSTIEGLAGALPDLTVEGTRRLKSLSQQAAHLGDRALEATATYHFGRALIESGDYEQAAESLGRARMLHQESGNQIEALRVSLGDIALSSLTGRARAAIEHGRDAIQELDRILASEVDTEERKAAGELAALIRSNLVIPLVSVGEFDEALEHSDASLEHAEASSAAHRAIAYSNRGHLLIEMGRPASGLPWTERAASLFEESDSRVRAARSHARSARAHALLGNYGTSLRRLRQAREDLAGLPGAADHLSIEIDMARVYATIGRELDALQLLDAAVPLMTGRSTLNDRATGLQLQAELMAEDQPAHSRRLIREAHDLLQSGGHHRDAALALLALGEVLPSTDGPDHSLLRDAFAVLDEVGTVIDRVRWRVVAVENDLLDGDARIEAIAAAEELERGISAPQLQWRLALQRGLAEVARGDLEAARGALHRSSDILHALRSNIRDEWLRTRFLAGRRKAIDSLGAVLLDLGLTDDLLELLDGAHGITLTERLQEGGRERARETSAELSMLYDELLSADRRRLRAIQPRIRQLHDEMAFGDTADLLSGRTEAVSDREDRRPATTTGRGRSVATPPGATLVAYGERDDEIYAIVSRPDGPAQTIRHVAGVEWLREARTSLALLQRRAMTPALAPHRPRMVELMRATMQDLHDGLIRPLDLTLTTGSDRLVVVPPASGVDVPFAALYDGTAHLLEQATITLTSSPSVATDVMSRRHRLDTARTHPNGPRTLSVGVGAGGTPASVLEAAEIAHRSAGTLLSGADATADNVRELMADHDILHLASHALSRTADPWFSGLQLSDRWVTAAEISGWRLDDQLIVLSGCDTGLQTTYEHRGANMSLELLGLPRAFLAAGAGGVIATLSDIDDTDAVRFMRPLHDNLRSHPPDEALRRTQRAFLADPGSLPAWSTTAYVGGPSIALREIALP